MGTISTNEFRKKLKIMMDGQPYMIIENQFVKPGKGQAFNRVRIKNLITSRVLERTWKSGDTVEEADVTYNEVTYSYNDGSNWFFLDPSGEMVEIPKDSLNGAELWLLDGATVQVTWWDGKAIEVIPPTFVDLLIVESPPGVQGNTSGNVMRAAILETGAEVQIPLFIEQGMRIKVDTRTREYVERSK
jgi:elongation factor P